MTENINTAPTPETPVLTELSPTLNPTPAPTAPEPVKKYEDRVPPVTIGRMVHYVDFIPNEDFSKYEIEESAAIVTHIHGATIDIVIFDATKQPYAFPKTGVPYNQEKNAAHTWHWPEKV